MIPEPLDDLASPPTRAQDAKLRTIQSYTRAGTWAAYLRLMQMPRAERLQLIQRMKHQSRCELAHRAFDPIYLGA